MTSLVRPDEYQRQLRETNPNATLIEVPPHTTGLAFDLYYGYMNAAEQIHVMSELGRLQDEGRIEVLKENRDHYHVFAFVNGQRSDERLIMPTLNRGTEAQQVARKERFPEKSRNSKRHRQVIHHDRATPLLH